MHYPLYTLPGRKDCVVPQLHWPDRLPRAIPVSYLTRKDVFCKAQSNTIRENHRCQAFYEGWMVTLVFLLFPWQHLQKDPACRPGNAPIHPHSSYSESSWACRSVHIVRG